MIATKGLNKIEELPEELFKLDKLKFIDVSGIGLKNIPKQIDNLKDLNYFIARENKIRSLPPELKKS